MSAPPFLSDNSHYEQARDQAIAMCDGNLRSTIKALIMVNEYLEAELEELQAAISAGRVPTKPSQQHRCLNWSDHTGAIEWPMSPTTLHCHSFRTMAARRSRARRKNARARPPRCAAPKSCRECPAASAPSRSAAAAIP